MTVQRTDADVQAASTLVRRDRLITKLWVHVYDGLAEGCGCSSWQYSRLTRASASANHRLVFSKVLAPGLRLL